MAADLPGRVRDAVGRAGSLRARITAVAVAVVGIALLLGSVLLLGLLRANLKDYAKTAAEQRVDTVAAQLKKDRGNALPSLAHIDDDEFVQILGDADAVLASTENAEGQPDLRPTGDGDERSVSFDGHPFVIVHKDVNTSEGSRIVVAGQDLEVVDDATETLSGLLLIGCPVLLLIVAAMAWFAVTRALAPVDRIRREADDITATELHRRLPEPSRQDEIGRLARTMNLMLTRLDGAQQRQRRFVSDAAHELRSPVASLKQSAEVASSYPEHLDAVEFADVVLSESSRLERLVDALLRLARLDEGGSRPPSQAVDIDDLVLEEIRRLRATTPLRIDATTVSAGQVRGDRAMLLHVVRNLVDNASRHASTTIALSLSETDGLVTLQVEDDGPGVPPGERERIFERFVRLDDARARDDGGSGLGLAIVREVLATHGGRVRATESPLGGACFSVTLPRLLDAD